MSDEIKLPHELWSIILRSERILNIEGDKNEYTRIKSLLDISLAKLLSMDRIYNALKLDIALIIRLLELTENKDKEYHLTHFVRDEKCDRT